MERDIDLYQFNYIFHLEPFPNDLEIKIFNLRKKIRILLVSALSVAYEYKQGRISHQNFRDSVA
jgi:hypothetical protein